MTQKEDIYEYMKAHGSISGMEAYEKLDVMKLPNRIMELKADGVDVVGVWMRAGNGRRYKAYSLGKEEAWTD